MVNFCEPFVFCNHETTEWMACAEYECGMDTTTFSFPGTAVATRETTTRHQLQSLWIFCATQAQSRDPNHCGLNTKCWSQLKLLRNELRLRAREEKCVLCGQVWYFQVRACPQLVRRCVASTPVESPWSLQIWLQLPRAPGLGLGFNGWCCFLFGHCHHWDEVFDAAFHHFLTFWESGSFSWRPRKRITKLIAQSSQR